MDNPNAVTVCQQCNRFDGVMEDPTFVKTRYIETPLWICELCAKSNIEGSMMLIGIPVN